MPQGRIRVRLKAYDHKVLDDCCGEILQTALSTGAKVAGPIPLPSHRKVICVTTSPHTDKDAREHFQIMTHQRFIDIIEPTEKTIDSLMHLELPAGVDIEIKM
jgi:small subunit ribosomal protein S10